MQSPVVLVCLPSACPRVSSSVDDNSCVLLTGVCRQAETLIQTSNEEPFLRAADAATAKKQAATSKCVTKMTSLGVTAPERTASAEVQQLASRQAMVRIQDGACVSAHKHLCHATLHLHTWKGKGSTSGYPFQFEECLPRC